MSFLNSVLSSIDTGDVSLTPPPARKKSTPDSSVREGILAAKGGSNGHSVSHQKRKAWDDLRPNSRADKISRPSLTPMRPMPNKASPPVSKATVPASKSSSNASKNAHPSTTTSKSQSITAAPSKPPPKGSYADIMLQAKALQGKAPTNVGMIRHQSVSKEKLSRAQQKRLADEAKQRDLKNKKVTAKSGGNSAGSGGGRVKEAILKSRLQNERKQPIYKGTARPPPRPKTATASTEPAYTGTAGLPSRRGSSKADLPTRRNQGKRPVRDEYLGTDEEDEGDFYGNDEEGDYYSDASSDMEAAYTDMEQEERQALRIAKKEDDEELRLELAAKKEKMERKKKLATLAIKPRY